jgi:hypothetical protein
MTTATNNHHVYSPMTTALHAARLSVIAATCTTAAEAIAGEVALDLCPGTLANLLTELQTLEGRLDLVCDHLAEALDPVRTP